MDPVTASTPGSVCTLHSANQAPSRRLKCVFSDQERPLDSPSSGRKRKLQLEQLALLPVPKHKFRHQPNLGESYEDKGGIDSIIVENGKISDSQVLALNAGPDATLDRQPAVISNDEGEDEIIEEECSYETAQELMLLSCSGDVGLQALGFAPAKWNTEEDVYPGGRRPTIDTEFEEYFSMLML